MKLFGCSAVPQKSASAQCSLEAHSVPFSIARLGASMTTADSIVLAPPESQASARSLRGLDWLNFFLAGVLTGFGPFVALYLAGEGWSQAEVGFILTANGLVGLLVQVPSGELLDAVQSKRSLVALGIVMVAWAAVMVGLWPRFTPALIAEMVLGATAGLIGPAVAAISLGLVGTDGLPERLGRNQRFAAIGGVVAAALMGLLGYVLSNRSILFASAAFAVPTLFALAAIRGDDVHFARSCAAPPGDYHPSRTPRSARGSIVTNAPLLIFAGCIVLFQFANASVLPLASEELGRVPGSSLVISALILIPQIVVAALAPWVGRTAKSWGRRPLLLIGLAALPLRAACFAFAHNAGLLAAIQLLDGVSGAVIGVLTPVVIADVTKGSGRFNLAQGIVGTFSGVGAALSTTLLGYVAQSFGNPAGFYAITVVAVAGLTVCWAFMPETKGLPLFRSPRNRPG
jgi:MFS family permease